MNLTEARALLEKNGQSHVLRYEGELSDAQREGLLSQIEQIDFSLIESVKRENREVPKGAITPLPGAMTTAQIAAEKEALTEIGLAAIRQNKVAAVLLAGGQGTRLGSDKPKGMYNIGLTRDLYIFECIVNNLMDVVKQAGVWIPLVIMTSDKNYQDTTEFFQRMGYFGYAPDQVFFFKQEMVPSVDYNGKIYLEAKDQISLSPNGNGGWFRSLVNSDVWKPVKELGVEYLNVFAVDNVLQRMADPAFVGAVIRGDYPVGAKVVGKAAPDEKVGVLCLEDGRPSIVEYYELTEQMMYEKNPETGIPAYHYGVILNYLFRVREMEAIVDQNMPMHIVEKKIPHLDENGCLVKPDKPNGYKFETLVLDMIHMLDSCLAYEVVREKEFAPIKNPTGIDSVESARVLLAKNGVTL